MEFLDTNVLENQLRGSAIYTIIGLKKYGFFCFYSNSFIFDSNFLQLSTDLYTQSVAKQSNILKLLCDLDISKTNLILENKEILRSMLEVHNRTRAVYNVYRLNNTKLDDIDNLQLDLTLDLKKNILYERYFVGNLLFKSDKVDPLIAYNILSYLPVT